MFTKPSTIVKTLATLVFLVALSVVFAKNYFYSNIMTAGAWEGISIGDGKEQVYYKIVSQQSKSFKYFTNVEHSEKYPFGHTLFEKNNQEIKDMLILDDYWQFYPQKSLKEGVSLKFEHDTLAEIYLYRKPFILAF